MKATIALAGAATLVGAETVVRAVAHRLPEERIWHDGVTQVKHRQMRMRRAVGGTGGVVFAGSSQMLDGVHPPTAAPALGTRAYNAALHRGFLPLTERWLADVVLPTLEPRLVVLGLSVLDLNDNNTAQHQQLRQFQRSTARREGWRPLLRRAAHERSAVVRHFVGRDPKVLLRDERVGPDGEGTEFLRATGYRLSDRKRDYIIDELLGDYTTGAPTMDQLHRVVTAVRSAGADVVLVEMPVTDEINALLPHGVADREQASAALCEAAARQDVRLVSDLRALADRKWFADCVHFLGVGMTRASALLRDALTEELEALA